MHHELHAKQPDIADEILASARANTRRDIALPLSWPQEPRQLIRFFLSVPANEKPEVPPKQICAASSALSRFRGNSVPLSSKRKIVATAREVIRTPGNI
jgi:hypothetical protein